MFSITRNGLDAITKELGVISNNIANSGTTAFKKSRTEFVDIYSKSISSTPNAKKGLGSLMQGSRKIMQQGSMKMTGGALDISVSGRGFFVLSPMLGAEPRFTRDGSFTLGANGDLLTIDGFKVAGFPGEDPVVGDVAVPLNIPLSIVNNELRTVSLTAVDVSEKGIIEATYGLNNTKVIGAIGLAKFVNDSALKSQGGNMYTATSKSGEQVIGFPMTGSLGQLKTGALEASNTDITNEMVQLLRTQQAFNGNARIMQTSLDVVKSLIEG